MGKGSLAPIVIPTLNRYEHLKKCLDSLGKCSGSDKSDIYISVDYPPSEKYVEGYKKVKEMLSEYDFGAFHQSYVIYHDNNLGASGNSAFIVKKVYLDGYDRFVFTEDDNVFSVNFLEYVNFGLTEFENDDKVFAVCGFNDSEKKGKAENIFLSDSFNAYGCGQWTKKCLELDDWRKRESLERLLYDKKTRKKLYREKYKKYWILVRALIEKPNGWCPLFINSKGEYEGIDHLYLLFMEEKHEYCVYPTVSKVCNIGCDGSGLHVYKGAKYSQVNLDSQIHFNPSYVKPLEVDPQDVKNANSDIYALMNVRWSRIHYGIMCFIYMRINKKLAMNIEDFLQRTRHNIWRIKEEQTTLGQLVKAKIRK